MSVYSLKNESLTDIMVLCGGKKGSFLDRCTVVTSEGKECAKDDHGIPVIPEVARKGSAYTIIEDHTIVVCGGFASNCK